MELSSLDSPVCSSERVARLPADVNAMREGLRGLGYDVIDSPAGIIPIMIGDTAEVALRGH